MVAFKGDCPHCRTRAVGFEIQKQIVIEEKFSSGGRESRQWMDIFGQCGQCQRGVVATVLVITASGGKREYRDITILPPLPRNDPPGHVSDDVGSCYRQGMDNMHGNWDAAGSMFRKSLEIGLRELKEKIPEYSDKDTLAKQIEKAAKHGALTKDMAEWAKKIKDLGNAAVHAGAFSEQEAWAMQKFTQLVLIYLFTLPGMMEEARSKSQESSNDQG